MIKSQVFHGVKEVKITADTYKDLFKIAISYLEDQRNHRLLHPPLIFFDELMSKLTMLMYFIPKERETHAY